uniref:Uncharacterized protein n=1 Tax=Arundo donax TaxID=35708 RepID=A0A0A9B0T2_ARUDO
MKAHSINNFLEIRIPKKYPHQIEKTEASKYLFALK